MPTLTINKLTLDTVIGVYDWERVTKRPLIFDFWLETTQHLVLNRNQIEDRIRGWVAVCKYQLLEALAEDIAQKLICECACQRVSIAIEKPGALGPVVRVGIRITRYASVTSASKN